MGEYLLRIGKKSLEQVCYTACVLYSHATKGCILSAHYSTKKALQPPVLVAVGLIENPSEALVGVGPTMADLQSAALATWLQRLNVLSENSFGFYLSCFASASHPTDLAKTINGRDGIL